MDDRTLEAIEQTMLDGFKTIVGHEIDGLSLALLKVMTGQFKYYEYKMRQLERNQFIKTADITYLKTIGQGWIKYDTGTKAVGTAFVYGEKGKEILVDTKLKDVIGKIYLVTQKKVINEVIKPVHNVTGDGIGIDFYGIDNAPRVINKYNTLIVRKLNENNEYLYNSIFKDVVMSNVDGKLIFYDTDKRVRESLEAAGLVTSDLTHPEYIQILNDLDLTFKVSFTIIPIEATEIGVRNSLNYYGHLNDLSEIDDFSFLEFVEDKPGIYKEVTIVNYLNGTDEESADSYRNRISVYFQKPQAPFNDFLLKAKMYELIKELKFITFKYDAATNTINVYAVDKKYELADSTKNTIENVFSIFQPVNTGPVVIAKPIIKNIDITITDFLPVDEELKEAIILNITNFFDANIYEKEVTENEIIQIIFNSKVGLNQARHGFKLVVSHSTYEVNTLFKLNKLEIKFPD